MLLVSLPVSLVLPLLLRRNQPSKVALQFPTHHRRPRRAESFAEKSAWIPRVIARWPTSKTSGAHSTWASLDEKVVAKLIPCEEEYVDCSYDRSIDGKCSARAVRTHLGLSGKEGLETGGRRSVAAQRVKGSCCRKILSRKGPRRAIVPGDRTTEALRFHGIQRTYLQAELNEKA